MRITSGLCFTVVWLAMAPLHATNGQTPSLRVPASKELIRGQPSGVEIASLSRGDTATLRAWRRIIVRPSAEKTDTLALGTIGVFVSRGQPLLAIDSVLPSSGSWNRADPYALLWSMERRDTVLSSAPGQVLLTLSWRGRVVDTATLGIRSIPAGISAKWVQGDGFAGAFAMPSSSGNHPAIILLHGSEGGDSTAAKALAQSFAAQGYASFALTYFSFGGRIAGTPTGLMNIPVEMADRARNWMGSQVGVDTSRTALWGGSKGAEFALVIASRRTWPRAVVGCVPSDIVWTGFGREPAAGERVSSWSDAGQSLPYVPYDRYDEALSGKVTARTVHDRSRVLYADSVAAARIDVRASRAPMLLLGGERDEVWSSGSMVAALGSVLGSQATAISYPMAGHGICSGTGSNLALQYERAYPTDTPPDARATAAAAADAWRRTVEFLRKSLR